MAVYGYDRIGRRVQKTMGTSEIRFIYDPAGRMIAEYANGEWIRDYVYGASGEAVYMRFPRTDEMIAAHDSFFGFLNAWLCSPYCTQDDLLWDINADNQINFVDWAADSNAFVGAFTINERFLLADSRNSVVGKVNLDSSVDLIAYTAFGAPYYAQGVDLEGLAVLWNGYYFDYETGNYYLRNRYYSPLERRFLTPDPHGVNPDGNWNNPFAPMRQYADGFGLQIYAGGDPVNNMDDWGLESACCKINETKTTYQYIPMLGGTGMTVPVKSTSCTQVTIDRSKKTKPGAACRCYYKNQPNVKVYDWHEGDCCWCKISLEFIGHTRIRVDCKDNSFVVHVYPDTFAAWDGGGTIHVDDPSADPYNDYYFHLSSSDISCKQAESLKSLNGSPWHFSPIRVPGIPGDGNCFQFASTFYNRTIKGCP